MAMQDDSFLHLGGMTQELGLRNCPHLLKKRFLSLSTLTTVMALPAARLIVMAGSGRCLDGTVYASKGGDIRMTQNMD
jgi:hypothetical protein